MQKALVTLLVIVFALGTAAIASAAPANLYADVPQNHWAYDAVSKLAKAGIVNGYGDGAFRGDRVMTRYEMAAVVANALTKVDRADATNKALIDKLAVEFAAELHNIGARLDKIETRLNKVEKNVSNIKISGDSRLRWVDDGSGDTKFSQRIRLFLQASVDENTTFRGGFEPLGYNEMGTGGLTDPADKAVMTEAAFVTSNFLGSTTFTAGRMYEKLGATGYWLDAPCIDGAKIMAGNELKVTLGFANFNPFYARAVGTSTGGIQDSMFVKALYPSSRTTTLHGFWLQEKTGSDSLYDVRSLGFSSKVSKDLTLVADYGKNYETTAGGKKPTFVVSRLTYGAVNPVNPGSWSLSAEYRKFEAGVNNPVYTGAFLPVSDVKGWAVIGSLSLAKNITMDAIFAFKQKVNSTNADKKDYTRFQVDYRF
jgi:hypothetical protein